MQSLSTNERSPLVAIRLTRVPFRRECPSAVNRDKIKYGFVCTPNSILVYDVKEGKVRYCWSVSQTAVFSAESGSTV